MDARQTTDWNEFSEKVTKHIEEYTIPQYGDEEGDYSVFDCIRNISKYASRHGRNVRPGQEALDLIKIAHYAQMAHKLLGGIK